MSSSPSATPPRFPANYERATPRTDDIKTLLARKYPPNEEMDARTKLLYYMEAAECFALETHQLEQDLEVCRDAHMANCLAADTLRAEIASLREQLSARSEMAPATGETPRTDELMHLLAGIELTMPSLLEHAKRLERELRAVELLRAAAERTIARLSSPSAIATPDMPRIKAILTITEWAEGKPDLLAHHPGKAMGPPNNISFALRELRGLLKKAVGL